MKNVIKLSLFLAVVFAASLYGSPVSADYYNYYPSCTNHAYRDCLGSAVYWYSSCGQQQELIQNCSALGLVCKYGQCSQPIIVPPPVPPYVSHYKLQCSSGNVYWYDSRGSINQLYKNCSSGNTCMQTGCSLAKCTTVLKCDGSTCAQGSADYNEYCPKTPGLNPNPNAGLTITFFAKKDPNSNQWQKTVQVNSNDRVYFMLSVANSSAATINNLTVSVNIPSEIASLGNLQVNGIQTSGDIVEGVNMGILDPGSAKTITFEGTTQTFSGQSKKQASASIKTDVSSPSSDTVSVDLNPAPASSGAAGATAATGFWAFLKRWYLWILMAIVLVFLFVIVFRRLSSGNE